MPDQASKSDNLFAYLEYLIDNEIDPLDREEEIWARYGRTVTVLVLDSSGFSRVSEIHGVLHFLSRLVLMRRVVERVMSDNKAAEIHFEADNVIAVFAHPDDAIQAALVCHQLIAREGIMLTADEPFQVCIGIGHGAMLHSETLEGYFAKEMNFASKLGEDTANGGETLITQSAYARASVKHQDKFTIDCTQVSGLDLTYYRYSSTTTD
ncbi:MAG: adenylate cyclase [Candidatus Azotimanducaceae bacterium]|jgi:adenylate cyclase